MENERSDRDALWAAVNNERPCRGLPIGSSLPGSIDGRSFCESSRFWPVVGLWLVGAFLPSLGFWLSGFGLAGRGAVVLFPLFLVVLCVFSLSLPAAGYRNNSSLNNAGSNGNYWSSTPNSSNTSNAYNLNFNSSNYNRNNNNRYNGQSVRPVTEFTSIFGTPCPSLFCFDFIARYFNCRICVVKYFFNITSSAWGADI